MPRASTWHGLGPVACLLLLAASSLRPCAAASGHDSPATELDVKTFDDYVNEKREQQRPSLIMFHVDWCKVCQRTFPKFSNASAMVIEKEIPLDFAHVDCTKDKTLCQRYNVKGYPTIKLFAPKEGAEPVNFRGLRNEQGFVMYAERMTLPALRPFADAAALDKALRNETLCSFVFASGGEAHEGLKEVADRWRDRHIFAMSPGALSDLLPEAVAAAAPAGATLVALSVGPQQWRGANKHAEQRPAAAFFTGSLDDEEAVGAWVEKNRFPGIWALDESNFYEFTHANRTAALVAVDPASVSKTQEKQLREDAAKLSGDFLFGVLDGVSWAEELKDFHISSQDLPRVFVVEDNFDAWVEDIDELKLDNLERDLRALLAGAPLLRQGRSLVARLLYNKREAHRFSLKVEAFAKKGWGQTAAVCVCIVAALVGVMSLGWCMTACCRIVMSEEPEDFPPPRVPPPAKKKD